MDAENQIRQLQAALNETQEELRSVPWLIGALRRIASYDCEYDDSPGCDCRPCTARYALHKYKTKATIPRF